MMQCPYLLLLATLALLGSASSLQAFEFDRVVERASELAKQPYEAPDKIPAFMRNLDYHDYQDIRFKPERSLWSGNDSRFQVMLVPAGRLYKHPVKIHVVDAEGVHRIPFKKSNFSIDQKELARRVPADLGYAGFKLTYPLRGADSHNQFLVFAGASYFRAVGRDHSFGLSARGIAINTGLPSGEEFPAFTEFWLLRPNREARTMTLYALLDGRRLSGAYRFDVRPGDTTRIDVQARLFTRKKIELLGIAPLTSMFYYGSQTGRPMGEWRPRVHDSGGLLFHDARTGERHWRPLLNPRNLRMDYFQLDRVGGYGLLQRQTDFEAYQDAAARYDSRPSGWVRPKGNWDDGELTLVQLPTSNETNDNIVSFWTPGETIPAGQSLNYTYTLAFGDPAIAGGQTGQAVKTFVGDGNRPGGGTVKGAYRVIVDFAGGSLNELEADTPVTGQVTARGKGEVIESFVEYLPPVDRWRLSILARPEPGEPLALRAFLKKGERALSETWSYEIPVNNTIRKEKSDD